MDVQNRIGTGKAKRIALGEFVHKALIIAIFVDEEKDDLEPVDQAEVLEAILSVAVTYGRAHMPVSHGGGGL